MFYRHIQQEARMKKVFTIFFAAGLLFSAASAQETLSEPEQLAATDRAFDLAVSQRGVEAWISFFAPNGSMIGDTLPPVTGRDAIRARMAPAFSDSSFSLRWKPVHAEMMIGSLIGYTKGAYERKKKDRDGVLMMETGVYTTVWMKQPDGSWKAVLDTGTSGGPARPVR
jgi:ketosteroid isomerase-like protein